LCNPRYLHTEKISKRAKILYNCGSWASAELGAETHMPDHALGARGGAS
jgi:hypothetical protein